VEGVGVQMVEGAIDNGRAHHRLLRHRPDHSSAGLASASAFAASRAFSTAIASTGA